MPSCSTIRTTRDGPIIGTDMHDSAAPVAGRAGRCCTAAECAVVGCRTEQDLQRLLLDPASCLVAVAALWFFWLFLQVSPRACCSCLHSTVWPHSLMAQNQSQIEQECRAKCSCAIAAQAKPRSWWHLPLACASEAGNCSVKLASGTTYCRLLHRPDCCCWTFVCKD